MLITLGDKERKQWPKYLLSLTDIYNDNPHLVIGFSPHYLVLRIKLSSSLGRFGNERPREVDTQWIRRLKDTQAAAWEAAAQNES